MNDWNNDIEDDKLESECMREDDDSKREETKKPEIIIKRVLKFGEMPCFKIYVNGDLAKVYSFFLNKPEDDLYNESKNLQDVKNYVDQLRSGSLESETIIDY